MSDSQSLKIFLDIWPILFVVLGALIGWARWSLGKKYLTQTDFAGYRQRQDARLEVLEREQQHSATSADIHRLEIQMTEMKGDVRVMAADMGRISEALNRLAKMADLLTEHHLKPGGGA